MLEPNRSALLSQPGVTITQYEYTDISIVSLLTQSVSDSVLQETQDSSTDNASRPQMVAPQADQNV